MDFTVIENGNAGFYVSAASTGPLAYQWFNGSGPMARRTNASLALNNVQPADVGGATSSSSATSTAA